MTGHERSGSGRGAPILGLVVAMAIGSLARAQTAIGPRHILTASHCAFDDAGVSPNHRVHLSLGGAIPGPATSPSFELHGGLVATLTVDKSNRAWIADVQPGTVTPRGGQTVTIRGWGFCPSTAPVVRIGSQTATITACTRTRIDLQVPPLSAPGRPVVAFTSAAGSAYRSRALGVLPLLEAEPAPAPGVSFELVFRGKQGDTVLWAAGLLPTAPIPLPPIHHGLELAPATLTVLTGFTITNANGEFRLPVPAMTYPPLFVQAMFQTADPGYAPGSFSNLLRL